MSDSVKIDEIDIKILSLLIKDARARLKDIAKECGISSVSALNRIKNLKKTGVITGTIIWPRLDLLGIPITATVGIDVESNEEMAIKLIGEQTILMRPSASLGIYDLLVPVMAENVTELDKIKYEARKCPGIRKVTINVWSGKPQFLFENLDLKPKGA